MQRPINVNADTPLANPPRCASGWFRFRVLGHAVLASILLMIAPLSQAAATQAMLVQAEALIKAGKAEAAFRLLEPEEVSSAGDSLFDYLLATAALESGKPSTATFIYERILAVTPNYVGVRADMGRAFYLLGDFARAKIEFETVLVFQNLPPDLRTQVEQYLAAMTARSAGKKTVMTGYMELGFGRDTNIGSATSATSLVLPLTPTKPYEPAAPTGLRTPDSYATVALGGEINHQLADQWGLYGGADYRIRDYVRYNDPNNYTLDGRGGVSYASGSWLLRSGLTAGIYDYFGQRTRNTVGLSMDWRNALSTSSQLTANGTYVRSTYVPLASRTQDVNTLTGTVGWLTALGAGSTYFNPSMVVGNEQAVGKRDDGDRRFWGPRVLLQTSCTETLGGYVTGGASRSTYRGKNTYYLISRRETLYDFAAALTWSLQKGISLRPQVTYLKNTSNADLYAYNKTDVSLNLRFDY